MPSNGGNGKKNPQHKVTILPPDPRLALAAAGVDPFFSPASKLFFNPRRPLWRSLGPAENCCYQHVKLGHH